MTAAPRELQAFLLLPATEQAQAIVRLSRTGMSEHSIASATRLSVEQIQRVLADAQPAKCERTGVPMQFCTCSAHTRGDEA